MGLLKRPSRLPWLGWLACSLLLGCGSTDDETDASGTSVCSNADCPAHCSSLQVDTCDVRVPVCQQAIFDAVLCVRGGSGGVPSSEVLSETEFMTRLEQQDEPPTPEEVRLNAAWESGTRLLRLLDPGMTHEQASEETTGEQVVGVYEYETDNVLIVDRATLPEGALSMVVLAHEYVHALQDREIGLETVYDETLPTDALVAESCLIEGEARLYEWLFAGFIFDMTLEDLNLPTLFADDLKGARSYALLSGAPLMNMLFGLRYGLGGSYLYEAWLQGGNAGVEAQYELSPASSVGWMAGYEAHQAHGGPWAETVSCTAPDPAGFTLLDTDTMGAVAWFALLGHSLSTGPTMPALAAWQQAQQWRGDHISLYEDATGAMVALAWTIRLDSDGNAATFAAQAEAAGASWSVLLRGREVHLLAAQDPSLLPDWRADLEAACP